MCRRYIQLNNVLLLLSFVICTSAVWTENDEAQRIAMVRLFCFHVKSRTSQSVKQGAKIGMNRKPMSENGFLNTRSYAHFWCSRENTKAGTLRPEPCLSSSTRVFSNVANNNGVLRLTYNLCKKKNGADASISSANQE
ncbi:hypothetical protein Y032_0172g341 [Ancylostoma ceylanicum]|uniref:Secreted protein n=2 Tax=Ancylostoma ceylanicum TaxID=53326 RepID=A0A016SVD7_9BILA|nr:hypothetical protein Y032_0172g341 [Ancylostoma ceylanicum]